MLYSIAVSLAGSIPFSWHCLFVDGVAGSMCIDLGFAVAAWGNSKSCTPKNERIKTCADVLIYSNLLMILINLSAVHLSPFLGLGLSIAALLLAGVFTVLLPVTGDQPAGTSETSMSHNLKTPMLYLILFVVIITINWG